MVLVRVLVVVGVLLAVVSVLAGYVRYQALDTPTVEKTANDLIADDEIATTGPLIKYVSSATSSLATNWHKNYGQWIIFALVALHVGAIAFYWLRSRQNLVGPMLHGDKLLTADVPHAVDNGRSRTIALAVLNGSGEAGLAGTTAEQARSLGYEDVTEGNAPTPAQADRVLFRQGAEAQARQVATDLSLPDPLPAAGDEAAATEPGADVIVVLGPS